MIAASAFAGAIAGGIPPINRNGNSISILMLRRGKG